MNHNITNLTLSQLNQLRSSVSSFRDKCCDLNDFDAALKMLKKIDLELSNR